MTISLVDGIELKDVKVQSNPSKGNLKDIEDKLGQLVCEVMQGNYKNNLLIFHLKQMGLSHRAQLTCRA